MVFVTIIAVANLNSREILHMSKKKFDHKRLSVWHHVGRVCKKLIVVRFYSVILMIFLGFNYEFVTV